MQSRFKWNLLSSRKPTTVIAAAKAIAKRRGLVGLEPTLDLGLKEIDRARSMIRDAIKNKARVAVHGDYDVDGITSSLICAESFREAGAQIVYFATSQRSEGYGLSRDAVERINVQEADLVVLTDLGSNNADVVSGLSAGNVLCIDHHRTKSDFPGCLLNPNHESENSPAKDLCAAALAYEVFNGTVDVLGKEQLALSALGTVADMAHLTGYNHAHVKQGLAALTRTSRPGLKWMLANNHVYGRQLTGEEVSWKLAPALNAPGRIGETETAMRAMSLKEEVEPENAARKCIDLNNERKYITEQACKYALELSEKHEGSKFVLVASSTFSRGIVGLIAGKLVRTLNRPVGVGAIEGTRCTYSFRSIPGFDLVNIVSQIPELKGAGGHSQAGGGRSSAGDVEIIRLKLCELLEGVEIPQPSLDIEFPLPANEIGIQQVSEMDMEILPYGHGNPRPVMVSRRCAVVGVKKMSRGVRVTFKPTLGLETEFTALSFDILDFKKGQVVDLAYTAEISRWRGEAELCLMVKDACEE